MTAIGSASLSSALPTCLDVETLILTSQALIPGLPNDLGFLVLSFIPHPHHARLKPTCKLWHSFFSSKSLFFLRRNLSPHRLSHLLCIFPQDPSISPPYLFHPPSLSWRSIPLMPPNPHAYGLCNFSAISLHSHLYILGGSSFDTRSFPIDRPSSSSSVSRFDMIEFRWENVSPMISSRGSFACIAVPNMGKIVVAGGGSRHKIFGAAGSRMTSVEMYDVAKDEWVGMEGLPRFRAGCIGFFVGKEEKKEFWVMGGYGESRTVSGVFPVDEYYRDAVVMDLKDGGKWREVGDMWDEEERRRPGKIVVVDDEDSSVSSAFMLDGSDIFRYDVSSNHWVEETSVPKEAVDNSSYGFVALDGELHVMTAVNGVEPTENRRARQHRRAASLFIQIYHPEKKTWRFVSTKLPSGCHLDFRTAVMCTIRL